MTLEEILAALDNLAALTVDELQDLRSAIATLYGDIRGQAELTDDDRSALRELVDSRKAVDQAIVAKETELAQAEAELAALDAEMADAEEGDDADDAEEGGEPDPAEAAPDSGDAAPDEAAPDATEEEGDGTDTPGLEADEEATADDEEKVLVTASSPARPARPSLSRLRGSQPSVRKAAARQSVGTFAGGDVIVAAADVPDIAGGSRITTGEQFANALQSKWDSVSGVDPRGGFERFKVLRVKQQFDADLVIPTRHTPEQVGEIMDLAVKRHLDMVGGQVKAMGDDVVLAAGGPCIPAQPDFTVEFVGDASRPFSQAFPTVKWPRGRISFYDPICFDRTGCNAATGRVITLAQDTAGYGSGGGLTPVKNCARIECPGDPSFCELAIMLNCVTIGNWVDRAWPEWVKVFRENIDTCYSVAYEKRHMAQVIAGSTLITAGPSTFGATIDFLGQILTIKERVRNGRRLPADTQWRLIIPDWFTSQLRIDLMRYLGNAETGFRNLSITDAQVIAWLRALNINVSVYSDDAGPTAQGDNMVLSLPTTGALRDLPTSVRTFFFKEGTWTRGTGGELDLGVVRDSSLNSVNDFQTFFEEWTSMCRRGCDSFIVDHEVCPSGLQGGTVALACSDS